jgi:hypothetical protein
MTNGDSFSWILWAIAAVMAIGSLVKLSMTLRDRLQEKLDNYFKEQVTDLIKKRRHVAERRRAQEMAKKLIAERQAIDAEQTSS